MFKTYFSTFTNNEITKECLRLISYKHENIACITLNSSKLTISTI